MARESRGLAEALETERLHYSRSRYVDEIRLQPRRLSPADQGEHFRSRPLSLQNAMVPVL